MKPFALSFHSLYCGVRPWWVRLTGRNLPGLGFCLRLLRKEFEFRVHGSTFVFDPRCAAAYGVLPSGLPNEPETTILLEYVTRAVASRVRFVDVGASIGEFAIMMAAMPNVSEVVAFEPSGTAAHAIERSAAANGFRHVVVVAKAVGDVPGTVRFEPCARSPGLSRTTTDPDSRGIAVACVTLDTTLEPCQEPSILLIDTEGSELRVLRGGRTFIERERPLIIFEYNDVTRREFALKEAVDFLGTAYRVQTLCEGGRLDDDLSNTWNCVAVPAGTEFDAVCSMMRKGR